VLQSITESIPEQYAIAMVAVRYNQEGASLNSKERCLKNPNVEFFKQIILEDLPLFKMLATNGKYSPEDDSA